MIQKINFSQKQSENNWHFGKDVSFKGAETIVLSGLSWMKNNPAMGACAVDMGSMVIPRTAVEVKDRGKQSGIETFIREVSSLILHATMGLIGFGAATLISGKFNEKYGVKAQNIFASGDTIQNLSELWKNSNSQQDKFFESFVKNISGLNGTSMNAISNKLQSTIAKDLLNLANKTAELEKAGENKKNLSKEIKNLKSLIVAKITKDTGASASYKLAATKSSKEISATLSELIDNAICVSNSFKTQSKSVFNDFVKGLMKNKAVSTILGLGITSLLCISVQPINRMLTKKRTGNDGFVGVDTKENDNSTEFNIMKNIAGIGFPIFAISTIDCKLKDLLSSVQFNGKIPSLNQFKLIYGSTISSRLFASRDGNELRESLITNTVGFSTWLLFGDFVTKLTSRFIGGKELINNPVDEKTSKNKFSYAKNWLMKSSVKSFEEIMLPEAQVIEKDGKPFSIKVLYQNSSKKVKTKVKQAALAQIIGYLFSGSVLGLGITKLNIFITKHLHSQDKARNKMNSEIKTSVNISQIDVNYLRNLTKKSNSLFKEF